MDAGSPASRPPWTITFNYGENEFVAGTWSARFAPTGGSQPPSALGCVLMLVLGLASGVLLSEVQHRRLNAASIYTLLAVLWLLYIGYCMVDVCYVAPRTLRRRYRAAGALPTKVSYTIDVLRLEIHDGTSALSLNWAAVPAAFEFFDGFLIQVAQSMYWIPKNMLSKDLPAEELARFLRKRVARYKAIRWRRWREPGPSKSVIGDPDLD